MYNMYVLKVPWESMTTNKDIAETDEVAKTKNALSLLVFDIVR
jgi:hypothetical protein